MNLTNHINYYMVIITVYKEELENEKKGS